MTEDQSQSKWKPQFEKKLHELSWTEGRIDEERTFLCTVLHFWVIQNVKKIEIIYYSKKQAVYKLITKSVKILKLIIIKPSEQH